MERFGVVGEIKKGIGIMLSKEESSALFFAQRDGFEEKKCLVDKVKSGSKEGEAAGKKMFAWNLSLDELRDIFLVNPLNPSLRGKVGERLMEMMDSPELVEEKIRQWLLLEPERIANALL